MNTDLLIDRLSGECAPVRCLRCPATRTAIWFSIAAPYVALMEFVTPGANFAAMADDPRFVIEQIAALLTAISAAVAAFAVTVPGYDRRLLLLPALPLLVWLSTLVAGSADEWMRDGLASLWSQSDWFCVRWILTIGAVPAIVMAFMLRKGAPMAPYATAALGGLAAASLGQFGLRLFHAEPVSVLMVAWHVGAVIAISALAGWAGRQWMCWRSRTGALRRKLAA